MPYPASPPALHRDGDRSEPRCACSIDPIADPIADPFANPSRRKSDAGWKTLAFGLLLVMTSQAARADERPIALSNENVGMTAAEVEAAQVVGSRPSPWPDPPAQAPAPAASGPSPAAPWPAPSIRITPAATRSTPPSPPAGPAVASAPVSPALSGLPTATATAGSNALAAGTNQAVAPISTAAPIAPSEFAWNEGMSPSAAPGACDASSLAAANAIGDFGRCIEVSIRGGVAYADASRVCHALFPGQS